MKRRDLERLSDEDLSSHVRSGETRAFATLWERHVRPGFTAARHFSSIADPDDIVAEAYLRIFRAMQSGGGPKEAFRPYLYRTIRNVALSWQSPETSIPLDEAEDVGDEHSNFETSVLENTITVRAFRSLPERWQTVLWYTEVEGMDTGEAAPILGLSPNATAALSYRAREGLKKAWLQAHVNDQRVPEECRWTTERMGEYARGGLTAPARKRFTTHVTACTHCSILVEEVDEIGIRLASVLLPVIFGGAVAAQILADFSTASSASAQPRSNTKTFHARPLALVGASVALAVGLAGVVALATLSMTPTDPPQKHNASEPFDAHRPSPVPGSGMTDTPIDTPVDTPADNAPPAPVVPESPAAPPAVHVPAPTQPPIPTPDTTPPALPVVSSLVDGALSADSAPVITGTGEPGAVLAVSWATGTALEVIASTTVGEDGTWTAMPSTSLPDGLINLAFDQVDAAGNRSDSVTLTITIDTIALAPELHPLSPGPLFYLPSITGAAEPFALVEIFDETLTLVTSSTSDAAGAWSVTIPDPQRDDQFLKARQTDLAGNISSLSADLGPIVYERPTIVTPLPDETVASSGGEATVSIQIAGVAGKQVQILIDGVTTGNIHTLEAAPITRLTPPLSIGIHTIGVRYIDVDERVGSLMVVTFTIS